MEAVQDQAVEVLLEVLDQVAQIAMAQEAVQDLAVEVLLEVLAQAVAEAQVVQEDLVEAVELAQAETVLADQVKLLQILEDQPLLRILENLQRLLLLVEMAGPLTLCQMRLRQLHPVMVDQVVQAERVKVEDLEQRLEH
jgi:hypothetical protein